VRFRFLSLLFPFSSSFLPRFFFLRSLPQMPLFYTTSVHFNGTEITSLFFLPTILFYLTWLSLQQQCLSFHFPPKFWIFRGPFFHIQLDLNHPKCLVFLYEPPPVQNPQGLTTCLFCGAGFSPVQVGWSLVQVKNPVFH